MSHPVTQDSSRKLSLARPDADLFCRVIDNFGDIAVCWRLARCLARDHGRQVRLWVDAPEALRRIKPHGTAEPGIEVLQWTDDTPTCVPAGCVIEAFACDLPPAFVTAMAAQHPPPRWINLEYLSAEDWVEGCHGLPSHDAASGLTKHFFFPGFTARTGGLLRERDLTAQRDAWLADAAARGRDLTRLGMTVDTGALQLSLFGYESPSIATLIEALAAHARPVQLWVPEGRSLSVAGEALGRPLRAGDVVQRGMLALHALAFMDQDDYDRLLWQCDLNIVRGEDSFVRAQWAARPLLWHIYPQDEGAHLIKLDAFLDRHAEGLPEEVAARLRALHRGWNSSAAVSVHDWQALLGDLPHLASHARQRAVALASQDDLATQLVMFNQPPI
ncbi:MAG: elongation factor P maturation arginine rhamnosyltransferase EarP [Pseudomonadota bacterium]